MQTRKELHERVKKASTKKILRRQLELLAEYSHLNAGNALESDICSQMSKIHKELIKAERIIFVRILIVIFGFIYLTKCIHVKGIKLIK